MACHSKINAVVKGKMSHVETFIKVYLLMLQMTLSTAIRFLGSLASLSI
jgi:hypothetical protein